MYAELNSEKESIEQTPWKMYLHGVEAVEKDA